MQRLEDGLVAERVLAALHHQLHLVVDVLPALLLQSAPITNRKTVRRSLRKEKTTASTEERIKLKWKERRAGID